MKKVILLCCLLAAFKGNAQQDTSRVEQYLLMVATPKMFSNKVTLFVDYGEERNHWKDARMKDEQGKLKLFNSVVDAMNYLGKNGWKLVSTFPISAGNGSPVDYHYIFKKEFSKADVEQTAQ